MPAHDEALKVAKAAQLRYVGLDFLRGVAALAVLVLHFPFAEDETMPQAAFLAVDMFFVLSGFVLTHAYAERLESGMTARRFMWIRFCRLYPLYILGTAMGIGLQFSRSLLADDGAVNWGPSMLAALTGLPLPARWSLDPESLYPFNFPAWSLFAEFVANGVFACCAWRLRNRGLYLFSVLSLLFIITVAASYGEMVGGWNESGFWLGLARGLFGFSLGASIYRSDVARRAPKIPAWLVTALFLVIMILVPGRNWKLDCFSVAFLLPVLMLLGARASISDASQKLGTWIGNQSYAIYALHAPIFGFAIAVCPRIGLPRMGAESWWQFPALTALTVFISALATRWFDQPAGRWLRSLRS